MYCTGQTPSSILNVSFGFVALVQTFFPFFPGLGFGSAGLSYFSSTSAPAASRRYEKRMHGGWVWVGFDVVELGGFLFPIIVRYIRCYTTNMFSLCPCQNSMYHTYMCLVFSIYVHMFCLLLSVCSF